MSNPVYIQILKARSDGLTDDQIAEVLGLSGGAADIELIVSSNSKVVKSLTVEELITAAKPRAVQVLTELLEDSDNPMARLSAAKIILTGQGELPELGADRLKKLFDQMKRVASEYDESTNKVIELKQSETNSKTDVLEMAGAI